MLEGGAHQTILIGYVPVSCCNFFQLAIRTTQRAETRGFESDALPVFA